jgi:hypothetical protein
MKPLLADYRFNENLRYEGHRLIYAQEGSEPVVLGGILGAALMSVRLLNTEEQKERGLILSEELRYEPFFVQYESEVIGDDWGYMVAELEQLDLAYLELFSSDQVSIETVCPNKRQLSIAMNVVATYMRRITIENYGAHIYERVPWTAPFAQWLFDAGHIEPLRQRFLQIDWTDPASVHELACYIEKDEPEEPVFLFEGEEAADIMTRYWDWLWNYAQKDAALFPDSKVVMADYKETIRENETDWDFIKPEMKDLKPEQINLFRKWMNQWTDFVKQQIEPLVSTRKKDIRQELFLDNISPIPPEHNYVEVKKYILERCRYDKEFEKYFKAHKRTDFCDQLSLLFNWFVDPNALGKRMKSKAKK